MVACSVRGRGGGTLCAVEVEVEGTEKVDARLGDKRPEDTVPIGTRKQGTYWRSLLGWLVEL